MGTNMLCSTLAPRVLALLIFSASGCGGASGAAQPLAPETGASRGWTVCGQRIEGSRDGLSETCEVVAVATMTARTILMSDAFFRVLQAQQEIYASKRDARKRRKLVPSQLQLLLQQGIPAAAVSVGDAYGRNSTASTSAAAKTITVDATNHSGLRAGCSPGEVSADLVATMAHEQMHLFATADGGSAYEDAGGRFNKRATLISYMAGNIALCILKANEDDEPDLVIAAQQCMSESCADAYGNIDIGSDYTCVKIP